MDAKYVYVSVFPGSLSVDAKYVYVPVPPESLSMDAKYVYVPVSPESLFMDAKYVDGMYWIDEAQPANIKCSVPRIKPATASILWSINGHLIPSQPDTHSIPQHDTTYRLESTLLEIYTEVDEVKVQCCVVDIASNITLKSVTRIIAIYCKYCKSNHS